MSGQFDSIVPHESCFCTFLSVAEQVDSSASLYASSIQSHHLCLLVKQLPVSNEPENHRNGLPDAGQGAQGEPWANFVCKASGYKTDTKDLSVRFLQSFSLAEAVWPC